MHYSTLPVAFVETNSITPVVVVPEMRGGDLLKDVFCISCAGDAAVCGAAAAAVGPAPGFLFRQPHLPGTPC